MNYYNIIYERAVKNYGRDPAPIKTSDIERIWYPVWFNAAPIKTSDIERIWYPVWFNAAEEIYKEFLDQGLTETAAHVRDIIETQEYLVGYKREPSDGF